jgi:VWFA-related protein
MRYVSACLFALSALAQDSSFDVESRLVLVPVSVTDAKGRTVESLEAKDFIVRDNGKPQAATVDTFATGVAPIALVIAVQTSGISLPVIKKVQKIGSMIQPIVTGDRGCAALLGFAERMQWYQECTNDGDALERAFRQLQPGDEKSGRMIDAVIQAVEHLRKRPNVRRVLLLISESRDRGSETNLEEAVIAAQTAGVAVYAATYSAYKTAFTVKPNESAPSPTHRQIDPDRDRLPLPPPEHRADLIGSIGELARLGKVKTTEVLIQGTGGAAFPFTRLKSLEESIQKLAGDLHTQYVLSFTPDNPAAGYHRLEVEVSGSREYRVRARPGYWSVQKTR